MNFIDDFLELSSTAQLKIVFHHYCHDFKQLINIFRYFEEKEKLYLNPDFFIEAAYFNAKKKNSLTQELKEDEVEKSSQQMQDWKKSNQNTIAKILNNLYQEYKNRAEELINDDLACDGGSFVCGRKFYIFGNVNGPNCMLDPAESLNKKDKQRKDNYLHFSQETSKFAEKKIDELYPDTLQTRTAEAVARQIERAQGLITNAHIDALPIHIPAKEEIQNCYLP